MEGEPSELNFVGSHTIPHLLGANSSYRKSALIAAGGYDEEYEYFLDETDLQRVISNNGWDIRQTKQAIVYHKYAPSDIHGHSKALKNWYPVIKNKLYFMLKHGRTHYSSYETFSRFFVSWKD